MPEPKVEEVFKTSGVPSITFVRPTKYNHLFVNLRTPGKGLVVEGPSGIGKTSAVRTVLQELGMAIGTVILLARNPDHKQAITELPTRKDVGIVIVDDFHVLDDTTKHRLADFMKILADEERRDIKLVLVGINRTGHRLINLAPDLMSRIDVITFEANPPDLVREVLRKGQDALNITFNIENEIVTAAEGSFYLAQLLAQEVCLLEHVKVLEKQSTPKRVEASFELVRALAWERLAKQFKERCRRFCVGPALKPAGRAPYLHILRALAAEPQQPLSFHDARSFGNARDTVEAEVNNEGINKIISNSPEIGAMLHYDHAARLLAIDDPKAIFFIKHIPWASFAKEIGFINATFDRRYDFALSFAGSDRDIAEALFKALKDEQCSVFYDHNEQHRMLASDLEDYLQPIYHSEADFVICILGPDYPRRIWTKFESAAFRDRFRDGVVIPLRSSSMPIEPFGETHGIVGLDYDRTGAPNEQASKLATVLIRKLKERRLTSVANPMSHPRLTD